MYIDIKVNSSNDHGTIEEEITVNSNGITLRKQLAHRKFSDVGTINYPERYLITVADCNVRDHTPNAFTVDKEEFIKVKKKLMSLNVLSLSSGVQKADKDIELLSGLEV